MEKRGHHDPINGDYHINISANSNTLKFVLIIEKDYQVDFNHQNSLAKVLGFTGTKYTEGFHESEKAVNILRINSILVNIDIISGSYVTTRFVIKTRFVIIYYKTGWENIITIRVDSYNPFCNKNPNCNKTLSLQ